jgi:Fe2+ transport system protein FeoA
VDIADELRRRFVEFGEVPDSVREFMEAASPPRI